jgi:hypothetical protein
MSYKDWVKIAADIHTNYHFYDAFIVLHGTDTMAYTTSALSFMLENLRKTVIVTGSQIPISQTRNDGFDNLLGSLTIAMVCSLQTLTYTSSTMTFLKFVCSLTTNYSEGIVPSRTVVVISTRSNRSIFHHLSKWESMSKLIGI